jgi:hypothetical protein
MVSVALADGAGGYGTVQDHPFATALPLSLAPADFDRDGNMDVAATRMGEDTLSVLVGDGAGGFSALENFGFEGYFLRNVVAGDFNEDGAPDLAFGIINQGLAIFLNDGAGSFAEEDRTIIPSESGVDIDMIATCDFDRDGHLDIIVRKLPNTPGAFNRVFLYLNDGTGDFSDPGNEIVLYTCDSEHEEQENIVIGDFNGDGYPDIASQGSNDYMGGTWYSCFTVRYGDCSGGVFYTVTQTYDDWQIPMVEDLVAGDLNDDGVDDLAVLIDGGYFLADRVEIWLGQEASSCGGGVELVCPDSLSFEPELGRDPSTMALIVPPRPGTVRWEQKISQTEGGFSGPLDDSDYFGSAVTSLGDLDGDGVGDVGAGVPADEDGGLNRGAVWVLFLNTDGTVKSEQKTSQTEGGFSGVLDNGDWFGNAVASLGDLDGDGVGDLAVGAKRDDDGDTLCGAVWVLSLFGEPLGSLGRDGDGIADDIDTNPVHYSSGFSDVGLGGSTSGYVAARQEQDLIITDAPDPEGVSVVADESGGALPATILYCSTEVEDVDAGDSLTLFCETPAASPRKGPAETGLEPTSATDVLVGTIHVTFTTVLGADADATLEAGNGLLFDPNTFVITAPTTNATTVTVYFDGEPYPLAPGESVDGDSILDVPAGSPQVFALFPSHPNPFRVSTSVRFVLDTEDPATLRVFDLAGREVRTLFAGRLPAGEHRAAWDGHDNAGRPVVEGIYFLQLGSGGRTLVRKIVRLD